MAKKKEKAACCAPRGGIKVEAVVAVDERGQMVLPKEVRNMAGIKPGDKLAVVSWEKDGNVCCISLVKVDELAAMVSGLLGPFMEEMSVRKEKRA